jgi:predicted double-glycine peptidase
MALFYPKGVRGSNILDFPELRQIYNYDCGASATQSVLAYYGYTRREDELLKKLKAVNVNIFDNGVKTKDMLKLFKLHDLKAEVVYGLEAKDLIKYIDDGQPVIVLLQAYKKDSDKVPYATNYKAGHYVVAIGYDANRIIFEDPSSYTRTFLTFKELDERWHAVNDDNEPSPISVAIVVIEVPKFKSNELTKMG